MKEVITDGGKPRYPQPKTRELSAAEKSDIREQLKTGERDIHKLAADFGCSASQVAGIEAHLTRRGEIPLGRATRPTSADGGMPGERLGGTPIVLRLPDVLLERLDRLVPIVTADEDAAALLGGITRSGLIRYVLLEGIKTLEQRQRAKEKAM